MNILLAYGYSEEATGSYFEKALRADHRVVTCGPSSGRPQDIPCGTTEHVRDIVRQLPDDFAPELFMWIESPKVFLPRGVETLDVPTVMYQSAALWNHFWASRYALDYDYVFVNSQRPEFYERAGNHRVFTLKNACWQPMAADVTRDRPVDIAFLGTMSRYLYPERSRLLARLRFMADRRGLNLVVGNGLYGQRLADLYQQAKIVFNAGFMGEGLNMRVFEAMACGCLAVTDNGRPPGVSSYFRDGEHLVIYEQSDLEERILYYLEHDDERLRIAAIGQHEVVSSHSYSHRFAEVLSTIAVCGGPAVVKVDRPPVERLLDEAAALYFVRNLDVAAETLAEVEAIEPAHPELPHAQAVLQALREAPDTEARFRVALEQTPSPLTALSYAMWLLEQGRPAEGEKVAEAVSESPDAGDGTWFRTYFPPAWNATRIEWLRIGLEGPVAEARAAFVVSWRMAVLANAASQRGDLVGARKRLQLLTAIRPEDPVVRVELGRVSLQLGLVAEALVSFDRALELNGFELEARNLKAGLLSRQGAPLADLRRARELALENVALIPDAIALRILDEDALLIPAILNHAAHLHVLLGEPDQARDCWHRSLDACADQPEITALLAGQVTGPPLVGVESPSFVENGAELRLLEDEWWVAAASSGWEQPLAAFVAAAPRGVTLVLHAGEDGLACLQDQIETWLETRGLRADEIPDVLLIDDARASLSTVCRSATAWIDNGDAAGLAIAQAAGLAILPEAFLAGAAPLPERPQQVDERRDAGSLRGG